MQDAAIFLFGLAMVFEAIVLSSSTAGFAIKRPLLLLALTITLVATGSESDRCRQAVRGRRDPPPVAARRRIRRLHRGVRVATVPAFPTQSPPAHKITPGVGKYAGGSGEVGACREAGTHHRSTAPLLCLVDHAHRFISSPRSGSSAVHNNRPADRQKVSGMGGYKFDGSLERYRRETLNWREDAAVTCECASRGWAVRAI